MEAFILEPIKNDHYMGRFHHVVVLSRWGRFHLNQGGNSPPF